MTTYRPWRPPAPQHPPRTVPLTPRQVDVLHGLCLGLSDRQISSRLGIAEGTAKTHLKRMYAATDTGSRAELVALVYSGVVQVQVPYEPWRQM